MNAVDITNLSSRPGLAMLAPALISRIIDEALAILGKIGVDVVSPALRTMLMERGLRADAQTGNLLFDSASVECARQRHRRHASEIRTSMSAVENAVAR